MRAFNEGDSCVIVLSKETSESLLETCGISSQFLPDVAISSKFLLYLLGWLISNPKVPTKSKETFIQHLKTMEEFVSEHYGPMDSSADDFINIAKQKNDIV